MEWGYSVLHLRGRWEVLRSSSSCYFPQFIPFVFIYLAYIFSLKSWCFPRALQPAKTSLALRDYLPTLPLFPAPLLPFRPCYLTRSRATLRHNHAFLVLPLLICRFLHNDLDMSKKEPIESAKTESKALLGPAYVKIQRSKMGIHSICGNTRLFCTRR